MAVGVSVPFRAQSTHDGVDTDTYNLKQDGVVVQTKPVADLGTVTAGHITFDYAAGLAAGSYQLVIEAVGPGGSAQTAPVTLIVANAPAAPGPVQIVVL